jgi:hypothetical protein
MRDQMLEAGSVRLRRPARGGWMLVLLLGATLAVVGGRWLWQSRAATRGWLALGSGLVVLSWALVVLAQRERSAELGLDEHGRLELRGDDGMRLTLALGEGASARRLVALVGEVVAIDDADGLVELGEASDDIEASAMVALVERASRAPRPTDLDALAGVRIERPSGALGLRWRNGNPTEGAALLGLLVGGAALVAAASLEQRRPATMAIGIALGAAALLVSSRGSEQRVRLAERRVHIEVRRPGRRARSQSLAIDAVVGVDAVHHLGMAGSGIVIRTEPLVERGVAHPGTHLSTRGMSLTARVALARALAAEIAERRAEERL